MRIVLIRQQEKGGEKEWGQNLPSAMTQVEQSNESCLLHKYLARMVEFFEGKGKD